MPSLSLKMNENFEPKIQPAIAEIKLSPNRRFHLSLFTMIKLGIYTYTLSSKLRITFCNYSLKLFELPLAKLTLVFSVFICYNNDLFS